MGSALDRLLAEQHASTTNGGPPSALDRLLADHASQASHASVGQQVIGAGEQVLNVFRHPVDAVKGIVTGAVDAARDTFSPVIGTRQGSGFALGTRDLDAIEQATGHPLPRVTRQNTPDAVTPQQNLAGTVNTVANIALPGVSGALTHRLANAGLGAINDRQQPVRGALTALLLGEAMKAPGAVGRHLDYGDGVMEAGAQGVAETVAEEAPLWGKNRRPAYSLPMKDRPPVEPGPDIMPVSVGGEPMSALDKLIATRQYLAPRGRLSVADEVGRRPVESLPISQRPPVEPPPEAQTVSVGGRVKRRPGGGAEVAPQAEPRPIPQPAAEQSNAQLLRDDAGNPLTVYHGSAMPIDGFDASYLGSNTDMPDAKIGFHFAGSESDARFYADMAARARSAQLELETGAPQPPQAGHVGRYHIQSSNPLVLGLDDLHNVGDTDLRDALLANKLAAKQYALEHGHDAIVYPHGTDVDAGYTAVAFSPKQIIPASTEEARVATPASRGGAPQPAMETASFGGVDETALKPLVSSNGEFVARPGVLRRVNRALAAEPITTSPPPPSVGGSPEPVDLPAVASVEGVRDLPRPSDILNVAKLNLADRTAEQRVAQQLEQFRALRDANRQTFADADVHRADIVKELTAGDPKALSPAAAKRLSGEELLARRDVVRQNDELIGALSKAIESKTLSVADHEQAVQLMQQAIAHNDALLSDLVVGSSQKGRDLNLLRRLANRDLEPDTWMVQAKRMLGDRPLTDEVAANIRRLSQAAMDACGGGA